jgi:hypothetical protein
MASVAPCSIPNVSGRFLPHRFVSDQVGEIPNQLIRFRGVCAHYCRWSGESGRGYRRAPCHLANIVGTGTVAALGTIRGPVASPPPPNGHPRCLSRVAHTGPCRESTNRDGYDAGWRSSMDVFLAGDTGSVSHARTWAPSSEKRQGRAGDCREQKPYADKGALCGTAPTTFQARRGLLPMPDQTSMCCRRCPVLKCVK